MSTFACCRLVGSNDSGNRDRAAMSRAHLVIHSANGFLFDSPATSFAWALDGYNSHDSTYSTTLLEESSSECKTPENVNGSGKTRKLPETIASKLARHDSGCLVEHTCPKPVCRFADAGPDGSVDHSI